MNAMMINFKLQSPSKQGIKKKRRIRKRGRVLRNEKLQKTQEIQNESSNEEKDKQKTVSTSPIRIGHLVWAHLSGYPWWPAKVYRVRLGDEFLVYFFGTDEKDRWSWVNKTDIRPFGKESGIATIEKYSSSTSKIISSLKTAIQEALLELERKEHSFDPGSDNEDICFICGRGGELLLCDGCPNAGHLHCAGLDEVPENNWYCTECQESAKSKRKRYPFQDFYRNKRSSRRRHYDDDDDDIEINIRDSSTYYTPREPLKNIIYSSYWKMLHENKKVFEEFKKKFERTQKNFEKAIYQDYQIAKPLIKRNFYIPKSMGLIQGISQETFLNIPKHLQNDVQESTSFEEEFLIDEDLEFEDEEQSQKWLMFDALHILCKLNDNTSKTNGKKLQIKYVLESEDDDYKLITHDFENSIEYIYGGILKKLLEEKINDLNVQEIHYHDEEHDDWVPMGDFDLFEWNKDSDKLIVKLLFICK